MTDAESELSYGLWLATLRGDDLADRFAFWPERDGLTPADQADFLRDLFGDVYAPCRLTRLGARPWLRANGGVGLKFLHSLVAVGNYCDLPVFADALEEGGCDALDVLAHLRGPGPHVRGCWALDALTGQT